MRVLILHQHFNTPERGGALRSYYLSKGLLENGIQPIVITAHSGKSKKIVNEDGIEVHYLPVAYENRFGFYQRGWSFMKFVMAALREAGKLASIDICYAISTPLTVGLAAQLIKVRFKIPYIFEVGDLWPDAPVQLGYIKSSILRLALYSLEKSIYRNANSIVALSQPIKDAIEKKISNKRIHVIPNMSEVEFFGSATRSDPRPGFSDHAGKLVVSYIGAIGVANGLEYFVDCARASQQANLPVHFFLCGDGAMKESIRTSVKMLGLNNFSILDFQNRDGVRKLMTQTDAVFVCYKPFPILETGSPNKYFDGLAAGKLIITNFGGWVQEEITRTKCGIPLDAANPADFVRQIKPFIADKNLLTQYQNASSALARAKYSTNAIGKAFADVLQLEIRNKVI